MADRLQAPSPTTPEATTPAAADTAAHAPPSTLPSNPVTASILRTLRDGLRGEIVVPGDPGYDEARAVWNGMIDRRPGAIARCADAQDVARAVGLAREHRLLLAVRGGGHNAAGHAVCDDGLVIDLSRLNDVEVDAATGTVHAGGGVTIGELDAATQAYGLAVPMGVVTETGIAGLTLSGGLGWLRRAYGLSADALVAAEVVTADGRIRQTSASQEPELFWALRGGGGNLGVVTRFTYQAYPVGPEVAFAMVVHDRDGAPEALRAFREWARAAPDEISAFAVLWHAPELEEIPPEHHGRPGVVFLAMHAGSADEGLEALGPLRALANPVADLSSTMPYLEVQRFFDEDYPAHELRYYWTSVYVTDLHDEVIDALLERYDRTPSPLGTIDIWQLGGELARVPADATAFGDRSAPYMLGIEANWEDPATDAANLSWARGVREVMQPHTTGGRYLNFPGLGRMDEEALRATFGTNLDRLVDAKTSYDPDNLFNLNANVPPRPPAG